MIVVSANIFRASTAWGNFILVLGLITMLGGAVLAVFSVNLKRTLACSSMSQIGFILTGIAMGCLLGEKTRWPRAARCSIWSTIRSSS